MRIGGQKILGRKRGDSKYEDLYSPADVYHTINDGDPDLFNLEIKLPEQPKYEKVHGYGLHPSEQKWERSEIPPKLRKLNDKRYMDVNDYWNELLEDYDYYKDELSYIEQDWEYRRNGYWLFINGKVTWLTNWHWFYIQWWQMDNDNGNQYADYRDRDKMSYYDKWYASTTTEGIFKYLIEDPVTGEETYTSSDKTAREKEKEGFKVHRDLWRVDMGCRTIFGINYPKPRREGATTRAQSDGCETITRLEDANMAIQSMTKPHAEYVYSTIFLKGWRGLPFWYIPINESMENPQSGLRLKPANKKGITGKKVQRVKALYSKCIYGPSTEGWLDTQKLKYYHADEVGKTIEADIHKRHYIVKKTLSTGSDKNITGWGINTSTVEEMNEGGDKFRKLCKESHIDQRDDTGQTLSGYINTFIPADIGLEGFVDEFGNSLRAKAHAHIMAKRKAFEEAGDYDGLIAEIRRVPLSFKECFSTIPKNKRFNIGILNKRLSDFLFNNNPLVIYGTLRYVGWRKDHNYDPDKLPTWKDIITKKTQVEFVPMSVDDDWDWEVSLLPDGKIANRMIWDSEREMAVPGNTHLFTLGADTFNYAAKTTSGEGSKGAGALYLRKNIVIDPPTINGMDINPNTGDFMHTTDRFGAVYMKRPKNRNEYCEQMLMAGIFWGTKVFPEINVTHVWDWISIFRKFPGYLQFRYDRRTGAQLSTPGANSTSLKPIIFNLWADWVNRSGLRENHIVVLEQLRDIQEDTQDFDIFMAGGYALMADDERSAPAPEDEEISKKSLGDYVRTYKV